MRLNHSVNGPANRAKQTKDAKDAKSANKANQAARRGALPEVYQLVVNCADEQQLQTLFERLVAAGYACRVIML